MPIVYITVQIEWIRPKKSNLLLLTVNDDAYVCFLLLLTFSIGQGHWVQSHVLEVGADQVEHNLETNSATNVKESLRIWFCSRLD